jgi:gluconolactonase
MRNEFTQSELELVGDGYQFTEGPLWMPGEGLIFTDIPADTIYRENGSVFRRPSGKANGLTLDNEGRLIACEHWTRRVTRTEADGTITVLADRYNGALLNSPNDVVVRSDGAIFFTDPPYGLEDREQEQPCSGVYMIVPGGELRLLIDDFNRPNGLALSLDESTLHIDDSREGHVRAFDLAADGTLASGRVFCEVPGPDGMKFDTRGYLWCTSADSVRVFDQSGKEIHRVTTPRTPANLAFGGEDRRTLYITARDAVHKIRCTHPGK